MAFWSLILIVLLALLLLGQIVALGVMPVWQLPIREATRPTDKSLPMTNWSNGG